jgi:hypothetical protein
MTPIYEIFQEKYRQQKLAHFYVLKSSDPKSQQKSENVLLEWPKICFTPILNGKNMLTHADFLVMTDDPNSILRETDITHSTV